MCYLLNFIIYLYIVWEQNYPGALICTIETFNILQVINST